MAHIIATSGRDFIHVADDGRIAPKGYSDEPLATDRRDYIDLSAGGNDIVFAGKGADDIDMGDALTARDRLNGGAGTDSVRLDGDYSAGLILGANTLSSIEWLRLVAGHDYKITLDNGNCAAGATLNVDASLEATDHFVLDATDELDGTLSITGGEGDDQILGGMFANSFGLFDGGNDSATGGTGADTFSMGDALNGADHLDGGAGTADEVDIFGAYAGTIKLRAATIVNVETILMSGGFDYSLKLAEATAAAGAPLMITASLPSSNGAHIDASFDTDANLTLNGGFGDDFLIGGSGPSVKFNGGQGADEISLRHGVSTVNTVVFAAPIDSTSTHHDVVHHFDFAIDRFDFAPAISPITYRGHLTSGTLSAASFDTDLGNAANAAHLPGPHDALIFTADAGDLIGHTYLVVNTGSGASAGYQASFDYVIELVAASHVAQASDGNFI